MTPEAKFIENHLLIPNKQGRTVRFKLNPVQLLYDQDRTNRDIVLKSRQHGISSFILALYLVDCLTNNNITSVVIAHDTESTQKLLDKVRFYIKYFHLKDEDKVYNIPLRFDNKNELYFPDTGSKFYIEQPARELSDEAIQSITSCYRNSPST